MNNDLISRSALKEEMEKADATAIDYESLVDMYERLVDNAPTVEERPQGEWIKKYKGQVNSFCSECDYEVGKITNFCPNCGADMRKGGADVRSESKKAEQDAYEEARREAMRLDDNEDTYKWRGHA